jgi:hypothetical protein
LSANWYSRSNKNAPTGSSTSRCGRGEETLAAKLDHAEAGCVRLVFGTRQTDPTMSAKRPMCANTD